MSLALPADVQAALTTWQNLIRDPMVWWEVGVLVLAAVGAWVVHRALSQGWRSARNRARNLPFGTWR